MYNIDFYRTENGDCDIEEFLEDYGTRLDEKVTKHLDDGIWELRPGNNRVMFFYFKDDTFVLLHHFRKKTQKTPKREIEKAKSERDDWISRKGCAI